MTNTSVLAPPAKPPANPTSAEANSFYTGTYQNAYYGPVTIDAPGGQLHLHIGPGGKNDYAMTHWDGNVFSFFPHRRERARHHGRDVRAQHREPGDEPHPRVLQGRGSRSLPAVVVGICTKCNVALSVVTCQPT